VRSALRQFLVCTLIVLGLGAVSCSNQGLTEGTVRFHHQGKTVAATGSVERLRKIGVDLLKSSSLNTALHPAVMMEGVPMIHDHYRRVVSNDCMIISFGHPVRIVTAGGDVIVFEIIIGLSRPDYADAVFTIDDEGRTVEFGKFDGRIAVELRKLVSEPAADTQP
jgi:hypothetical protein